MKNKRSKSIYSYNKVQLRMALEHLDDLETAETIDGWDAIKDTKEGQIISDHSAAREREVLTPLLRAVKKRKGRQSIFRMSIAAACLILILGVSTPQVRAAVTDWVVKGWRLVFRHTSEYTEVRMEPEPTADFIIPRDWAGKYFPAYIPKGFELKQIGGDDIIAFVVYRDLQGNTLSFDEYHPDVVTHLDTEGSDLEHIEIMGNSALLSFTKSRYTLVWMVDDKHLILSIDADRDTVLQVARNVKKIY